MAMVSRKKKAVQTIEYWTCLNALHRHTTEEIALRCIRKQEKKKKAGRCGSMHERRARNILVAIDVVNGSTYKDAGKAYGVCTQRVGYIIQQLLRYSCRPQLNPPDPPRSKKGNIVYSRDIKTVREHRDYWLDRIEAVANHWGVPTQPPQQEKRK